jgi:hypothetical protein
MGKPIALSGFQPAPSTRSRHSRSRDFVNPGISEDLNTDSLARMQLGHNMLATPPTLASRLQSHPVSRRIGSARTAMKREKAMNMKHKDTITTAPKMQETVLNGVNVTRLGQAIEAIRQQPELAHFKFRARNQWDLGTHSVATVSDFYGTCRELQHQAPFVLHADEPPVLLGRDTGAGAAEYVLAGLSACLTGTLAYLASARGLKIEIAITKQPK